MTNFTVTDDPKISCLCLTSNRINEFKNAYLYYQNQSYKNKEFVVVCSADDYPTVEYVEELQAKDESVKACIVTNRHEITLGDLRNLSINEAQGEYICIWDDDDTYHPDRLSVSLSELRRLDVPAVAISNVIMFDERDEKAYISPHREWEASLFCSRRFLIENNLKYPSLNRGEDTPLLEALNKNLSLIFYPHLYIYKVHSKNTCPTEHLSKLIYRSIPLMPHENTWIQNIVKGSLLENKNFNWLTEVDYKLAQRRPYKQIVAELAIEV
ncbi:glycosyltransferase family 2 protein [Pseudoalteromonas luteoviolacea]|uniref:Glycosyltransferase 2-like domain-containing protein n=1 Tax=Pseudoalteromonas luteoviolacea NCIMB 1942 TaxID=1365253 RepID=A0A161YEX8_9GAMM|nr:glycosyltransferase family A protein [Pseudoalteromonas luteoviolacea]KZN58767.1 hypothetical protein N482_21420 [Pseudoalteromonas luteoviolacea NCIMB 1942]KZX00373.1 hypothetical protein JL49_11595 [Pseudoalteromonas luteoviolacea]